MANTKIPVELSSTPGIVDGSNATAITIDSSERVGIGTSSPTGKLEIAATGTNAAPHIKLTESGDTREFNIYNDGSGNGRLVLADSDDDTSDTEIVLADNGNIQFKTATSERMLIDSSGNVGLFGDDVTQTIDNYTNYTTLTLSNNTGGIIQFEDDGNAIGEIFNGTDNLSIGTTESGASLRFRTDTGTEAMRINSSGYVGINNSNPQYGLDLTGSANFESAYTANATVLRINNTNSSNNYFAQAFYSGGTLAGYIFVNSSNNTTQFATSSDYRLKENINYDFDALSRVKQLKPARFNFKTDADTTVDGFIAHEVSDIVPEAIIGEKDGELMQGIDQSKLVPILTKAIQEQQTLIETQQTTINDLKSRIETLEG